MFIAVIGVKRPYLVASPICVPDSKGVSHNIVDQKGAAMSSRSLFFPL